MVGFTKSETRHAHSDTVRGTLYSYDNRLVVSVVHPITQFILIDSLNTVIWNKDEGSVVHLRRKTRSFLPSFHTFIGFIAGEQAIPASRLTITESKKHGDTLITIWAPAEKKGRFKGRIETAYTNDRPLHTHSFDNKGRLVSRMLFSNDTTVSGKHVPLRIVTITLLGKDTLVEDLSFRDLHLGCELPDSIKTLTVPSGVPVRVIDW